MHDKFTERLRKAVYLAREEAARLRNDFISTEHLLLGLVRENEGIAALVLMNIGVDLDRLRQEVEGMSSPPEGTLTVGEIPFTPRGKRVLELAVEEARSLRHNYVGTEHLLLGLIREGEGIAAKALAKFGVDRKSVREETIKQLGDHEPPGPQPEQLDTPALNQFGRDLTQLARQGKLDPVIGRFEALERIIGVLCKRSTNNPAILSPPGIGRQAMVEGVAIRIAEGKVPSALSKKRVVSIDIVSRMIASADPEQFRKWLRVMVEETRVAANTILVLDDFTVFMPSDSSAQKEGAPRLLMQAIRHGELQCMVGLASEEYHQLIALDSTLHRLLEPVFVPSLSREETVSYVMSARDRYEAHHAVRIGDEAVLAAVELSELYRPDQPSPDNALDLIDESCAALQLDRSMIPIELLQLEGRLEGLVREKEAKIRGQEYESAARLREQEKDLRADLKNKMTEWRQSHRDDVVLGTAAVEATVARLSHVPLEAVQQRSPRLGRRSPAEVVSDYERRMVDVVLPGSEIKIQRGTGFVLLPHEPEFEAIFDRVIRRSMASNGIEVLKANDIHQPGAILAQVWRAIRSSEVIVADVTGQNRNVVFELGLCFGLGRLPILITQEADSLPFNLRSLRYNLYSNNAAGLADLETKLTAAISEFLSVARAGP